MSRIRTARLQVRNPDRSYASGSSAGEGIPVARIRLIRREKVNLTERDTDTEERHLTHDTFAGLFFV